MYVHEAIYALNRPFQNTMTEKLTFPNEARVQKEEGVVVPTIQPAAGDDIPEGKLTTLEDHTPIEASITTHSSHVPQPGRLQKLTVTIYRIGVAQVVFGIFIFSGIGLYLGLVQHEDVGRRRDYFGESCQYIYPMYPSWVFFDHDEGYIQAAIVGGVMVRLQSSMQSS